MKIQVLKFVVYFMFLVINSIICFAQDENLPDSPDGGSDPLVDPAPINNSIWILIVLAMILGVSVLSKKKKHSEVKG